MAIANSVFLETKKVFDDVEIKTKVEYAKEEIEKTLDELKQEIRANIPALYDIDFDINSDYEVGSILDANNRMNIFVSYSADLEMVEKKIKLEGRKGKLAKALYNSLKATVTPSDVALYLLNAVKLKFKSNVKYYRDSNVIAVKIPDLVYLRFIVGYKKEDYNVFKYFGKTVKNNVSNQTLAMLDKSIETSGKYIEIVKMFKVIELELLTREIVYSRKQEIPGLIESLLYNVPNKLFNFEDEKYNIGFLKILNYLLNADLCNFKTPDLNLNMFENNGVYNKKEVQKLLENIAFFCENFE